MRTEDDLRTAIAERADQAPIQLPARDDTRRAVHHLRSRTGIAIAAAAVAVAAIAIVPAVLHNHHHGRPTAAATKSAPRSAQPTRSPAPLLLHPDTWISYSGADAVAAHDRVEAQYIDLHVGGTGLGAQGRTRQITAYAPGLFTKSLIHHAQPITVNGVHGYFGAILPWYGDGISHATHPKISDAGSKSGNVPAIAWKIGADQWASVASELPSEDSPAALKAIAAKVHLASTPIRTPLTVGYVPPGQKLIAADYSQANYDYNGTSSLLGFGPNTDRDSYTWTITYTPPDRIQDAGPPPYPVETRRIGNYTLAVDTLGAISAAQAKRVLASITLASQPHAPNRGWPTLPDALS